MLIYVRDVVSASYAYTREHKVEVVQADFVPPADEITANYQAGTVKNVMLHDGGWGWHARAARAD